MVGQSQFFPYNPRALRIGLFACAGLSAALAAWALAAARTTGSPLQFTRAGLLLVLLAAFASIAARVRPRPGWGVQVHALGITIARPLTGTPLEFVWSQFSGIRRERNRLALSLRPQGRVVLPRRLFASTAQFETLVREIEERLPLHALDA